MNCSSTDLKKIKRDLIPSFELLMLAKFFFFSFLRGYYLHTYVHSLDLEETVGERSHFIFGVCENTQNLYFLSLAVCPVFSKQ